MISAEIRDICIINIDTVYRIKRNKRVLNSADLIVKGLTKCIRSTPFEQINVCDIAAASGVSRSTFYRLFDTPSDILAYICDKLAEDTIKLFKNDELLGNDQYTFGINALRYWCSQTDIIETIFRSGCSNILQKSFETYSSDIINSVKGLSEKEFDYLRTTVIGIICSILVVWTRYGRKETPEELMETYKKIGKVIKKVNSPL